MLHEKNRFLLFVMICLFLNIDCSDTIIMTRYMHEINKFDMVKQFSLRDKLIEFVKFVVSLFV